MAARNRMRSCCALEHGTGGFRHGELHQPRLLGGVDDNHLPTPFAAVLQHVDEAGVVGRRIGANYEDKVGACQIFQFDRGRVPLPIVVARPSLVAWWQ